MGRLGTRGRRRAWLALLELFGAGGPRSAASVERRVTGPMAEALAERDKGGRNSTGWHSLILAEKHPSCLLLVWRQHPGALREPAVPAEP
jgi:hypothetical protein